MVPLSEVNDQGGVVSLEQDFSMLQFRGDGHFDVIKKIMRTSFSQRIDRDQIINEQIDADFFHNSVRNNRLVQLETTVGNLETQFKVLTQGKQLKLAELVKEPEVASVLAELRK